MDEKQTAELAWEKEAEMNFPFGPEEFMDSGIPELVKKCMIAHLADYKASLRAAIEKEINIKNQSEYNKDFHENFNDAFNAGLRKSLELLDTVTPTDKTQKP